MLANQCDICGIVPAYNPDLHVKVCHDISYVSTYPEQLPPDIIDEPSSIISFLRRLSPRTIASARQRLASAVIQADANSKMIGYIFTKIRDAELELHVLRNITEEKALNIQGDMELRLRRAGFVWDPHTYQVGLILESIRPTSPRESQPRALIIPELCQKPPRSISARQRGSYLICSGLGKSPPRISVALELHAAYWGARTLTRLDLSGTPLPMGKLPWPVIYTMTNLTHLDIRNCNVDDDEMLELLSQRVCILR